MPRKRTFKRVFSYEEALSTFPVVRDVTAAAVRQIDLLTRQLGGQEDEEPRREDFDQACQRVVISWAAKVSAVGCEVKGLWLVDWDSGDGYYCWRFPEESISFFHDYEEGFSGRLPIN